MPDEDRLELSPPDHPDPQRGAAQNVPEIPSGPSGGAAPGGSVPIPPNRESAPAAFHACVDRELSRRGLNAFGDPPGTASREVADRYEYVTRRYPDIGTVCSTSPW